MARGFWSPLLALLGGTADDSFTEISGNDIRFRFGHGFDLTVTHEDVVDAYRTDWPLIGGIGWRIGGKCVGLIGSCSGVVEIVLRESRRGRVYGLPYTFRRIAISLEDPDGFLGELRGTSTAA